VTEATDETGSYEKRWSHHKDRIRILVRSTEDYITYVDIDDDLDWETSKDYDKIYMNDSRFKLLPHAQLKADIAVLHTTPTSGLDRSDCVNFKILLAEALACCFDFEYTTGTRVLGKAIAYIKARGDEKSRMWYLIASLRATAPLVAIGALLVLLRQQAKVLFGIDGFWLYLAVCAGGIGALFSIIGRSGKLQIDPSAGRTLHTFEASSHIVAGAISGLLAGLAIRSHLLFGTFVAGQKTDLIMLTVALAAGTGERLATSIINKVQSPIHQKDAL